MRRGFMLLMPFAAFGLAACQPAASEQAGVNDAWVRLSPIADRPAAGYFTLRGGAEADRLIAVESGKASRIELHESGMQDGMMTMRPIDGVDVPAGGEVRFVSGGNHIMLFGLSPDVKPGGDLPLTFRFRSGKTIAVQAAARAAGDAPPGHMGH
ncbi:copper chaperone PCu(A)C [Sphingomonas sp. KC8]|uniref:copper chaperone PCu(A)C n=1 Tax=Sphingomonas sp. KC8 TaxID=1030157 RepID=UPI0002D81EAE|nr:copper chaperone PCu(A)C [Sphingomonas sp. KC8]ARS29342.1 hypothetical protein KC8_18895 [Sphingomonas sp. KC8]